MTWFELYAWVGSPLVLFAACVVLYYIAAREADAAARREKVDKSAR